MGVDPRVAAIHYISGHQYKWLQVGQVSEEAASDGWQLDTGFSQETSDSLERGGGVMVCLLLEFELPQLYSLRSSTVALSGKNRNK